MRRRKGHETPEDEAALPHARHGVRPEMLTEQHLVGSIGALAFADFQAIPTEVDKVRALELIGRHLGMFGGSGTPGRGGLRRAMAAFLVEVAEAQERRSEREAAAQRCGAKTRAGKACRCCVEPGKNRCRFHGGKSTGPRTPEGRARSMAALQAGHQRWRERQVTGEVTAPNARTRS